MFPGDDTHTMYLPAWGRAAWGPRGLYALYIHVLVYIEGALRF